MVIPGIGDLLLLWHNARLPYYGVEPSGSAMSENVHITRSPVPSPGDPLHPAGGSEEDMYNHFKYFSFI